MEEVSFEAQRRHPDWLRRVQVRPIVAGERERWDALVRAHHYLGLRSLVGKSLRYVAVLEQQWLALLGWQGAALKCGARDRWIGWPPALHYPRLHLIANNSRFLILPASTGVANLASRVLALNLRRLAEDWRAVHGHPVVLAETFVDIARFTGACYRAANWIPVGHTRGFSKHPSHYTYHNQPKWVLLYPLHRHARHWLRNPRAHPAWSHSMQTYRLSSAQMEQLYEHLRRLPDVRGARGKRHRYTTVVCIALAAVLGGMRSYLAIAQWAKHLTQNQLKRLRARYNPCTRRFEPPSETTLRRVIQGTDAGAVDAAFGHWLMAQAGDDDAVAVDGKTLKGALRPDGSQVHLLSAVLQHDGVTIAQREVGAKTNEIPELPRLLEPLELDGRTVTADALHTQRETARYLVEDKRAHYVFIAKDNQPTLHQDIAALPWELSPPRR